MVEKTKFKLFCITSKTKIGFLFEKFKPYIDKTNKVYQKALLS